MMRNIYICAVLAAVLALAQSCILLRPFTPTEIVKHPEAPMLILEAKGNYLRVAVYDRENNEMIEYGWISVSDEVLKSWTLSKYDWEAFIVERGGEND